MQSAVGSQQSVVGKSVVGRQIVLNKIIDVDHENAAAVHTFKSKMNICDFARCVYTMYDDEN